jgi:hypothetical protein
LWLLTVIVLGGLSFLNTWDVLIHLFVVLGRLCWGAGGGRLALAQPVGHRRVDGWRCCWQFGHSALPAVLPRL